MQAAQEEKRGLLVNQNTGQQELLVLRKDSLRVFETTSQGKHLGLPLHVLLSQPCEAQAKANGVVELQPRMPAEARHLFVCSSEAEARGWQQNLQRGVAVARESCRVQLQALVQGHSAHKYNYSNSKRMRRHFWVDEGKVELRWGKNRAEPEPQTMDLRDCMGIIYGPMTSTFLRCPSIEDPSWCCFSLLFQDRTLDLAVPGDAVETWFLGLQWLLLERGSACQAGLTRAQFLFRKVCLKLRDAAHAQGLTTCAMLLRRLRALGQRNGGASSASSKPAKPAAGGAETEAEKAERRRKKAEKRAAEAGGAAAAALAEPKALPERRSASERRAMTPAGERRATTPAGARAAEIADLREPRRSKVRSSTNGDAAAAAAASQEEELLGRMAQDLEGQLQAANGELEALKGKWAAELGGKLELQRVRDALRWDGVGWQVEKCSEMEREVLDLRVAGTTLQGQKSQGERAEKQLKRLAKQIKDTEGHVQSLEQELGSVQAGAQSSEQAKNSTANALERTEATTSHLERRVRELEQRLQQGGKGGELATLRQQNKKQAEELSRLEAAKAELAKKLESVQRDCRASEARRGENLQKLSSLQGSSKKLVGSLQRLRDEVGLLKAQQAKIKGTAEAALRSMADEFPALGSAVQKIKASHENLLERYQEISLERKKLHNLVLELKGNIRVFVRVRPMNEKEKMAEAPGEATISYAEDCKVSVFEAAQNRRKWFEFDRAFQPKSTQQEVFEEVKPLATSVLDGYNVCIFAYGQTGSGKTFTMNGTSENPGLNVRVLKELFREREERRLDMEIRISLMITEIYNETIKDLFVTKQKKLDVKQNADGSNSVPGLTELPVESVEEVMTAMREAQSNRTVMATDMNEESSRSHSIVQVRTVNVSRKDRREYIGKINLIDLAGSENVNKSGVSGQGMREAQNINKSLSALGDVIGSLVAKSPHIPYRNSKLTMMLKDSLGGDSKTLMIVQSSPAQVNVTETLSSLNFASRARNVELGKAKRNVKGGD